MDAEAGKELLKETVRAFKAGMDGDEYENPFTGEETEGTQSKPTASAEELLRLEREWLEAVKHNDMERLGQIVGAEYTLTATGIGRVTRDEWMETVPIYDIHAYEFHDIAVQDYGEAAVVLARIGLDATVAGTDRSGTFFVTDTWIKRDGRWQVVARGSIFTPRQ